MIDYSRITESDYYKSVIYDINRIDDLRILSDLLKQLSRKITYKEVDPTTATMVLSVIRGRMRVLNNTRGGNSKNSNYDVKKLALSPTSVSGRAGRVSLILLVTNVAIVSIMYTLLFIASLIK